MGRVSDFNHGHKQSKKSLFQALNFSYEVRLTTEGLV